MSANPVLELAEHIIANEHTYDVSCTASMKAITLPLAKAFRDSLARCELLEAIAIAAQNYRRQEQDDTPRMYKGKELCDFAALLDDAIEQAEAALAPRGADGKEE